MTKQYTVTVNGTAYEVTVESVSGGRMASAPVARTASAPVARAAAPVAAPAPAAAPAAPKAAPAASGSGETVSSPMPGTILDVKVAPATFCASSAETFPHTPEINCERKPEINACYYQFPAADRLLYVWSGR